MAKHLRWLLVLVMLAATACGAVASGSASGARIGPTTLGPDALQLRMFDPMQGWASTGSLVAHTSDGALTFHVVTPPGVGGPRRLGSIFFLDSEDAWATVVEFSGSTVKSATLERTDDSGATWHAMHMGPPIDGELTFVDRSHGWIDTSASVANHTAVERSIWRTTDGGETWSKISSHTYKITIEPNVQTGDCSPGSVQWTSPTRGVAGVGCPGDSPPAIDVTNDGGATWSSQPLPPLPALPGISLGGGVGSIQVFPGGAMAAMVSRCIGSDGMSCREYGELYRSTDGGATWSHGAVTWGAGAALMSDSDHAWLPDACQTDQCSKPQLIVTSDGGQTWHAVDIPQELWPNMHGSRIFSFVTAKVGFVVVTNEFEGHPTYLKTTDGGLAFAAFTPRLIG